MPRRVWLTVDFVSLTLRPFRQGQRIVGCKYMKIYIEARYVQALGIAQGLDTDISAN